MRLPNHQRVRCWFYLNLYLYLYLYLYLKMHVWLWMPTTLAAWLIFRGDFVTCRKEVRLQLPRVS